MVSGEGVPAGIGPHQWSELWCPPSTWRATVQLKDDPIASLSFAEKAKLYSFQRQLENEGHFNPKQHDLYMLRRFLKARQWDPVAARQMWIDMLAFRQNNGVDQILEPGGFHFHERAAFLAAYPHGLHKTDRQGRPILVYKLGETDLEALRSVTSEARMTVFHIQEYERIMRCVLPACSVAAGRHIEQIVTLFDVQGLRMKDMMRVKDLLSMYIKVDSNNYPETLGSMIIINAPYWFSGMFAAVKAFLPGETQKKVHIVGSNYKALLDDLIPPESLLAEYGGKSSGSVKDNLGLWYVQLEQMRSEAVRAEEAMLASRVAAAEQLLGVPADQRAAAGAPRAAGVMLAEEEEMQRVVSCGAEGLGQVVMEEAGEVAAAAGRAMAKARRSLEHVGEEAGEPVHKRAHADAQPAAAGPRKSLEFNGSLEVNGPAVQSPTQPQHPPHAPQTQHAQHSAHAHGTQAQGAPHVGSPAAQPQQQQREGGLHYAASAPPQEQHGHHADMRHVLAAGTHHAPVELELHEVHGPPHPSPPPTGHAGQPHGWPRGSMPAMQPPPVPSTSQRSNEPTYPRRAQHDHFNSPSSLQTASADAFTARSTLTSPPGHSGLDDTASSPYVPTRPIQVHGGMPAAGRHAPPPGSPRDAAYRQLGEEHESWESAQEGPFPGPGGVSPSGSGRQQHQQQHAHGRGSGSAYRVSQQTQTPPELVVNGGDEVGGGETPGGLSPVGSVPTPALATVPAQLALLAAKAHGLMAAVGEDTGSDGAAMSDVGPLSPDRSTVGPLPAVTAGNAHHTGLPHQHGAVPRSPAATQPLLSGHLRHASAGGLADLLSDKKGVPRVVGGLEAGSGWAPPLVPGVAGAPMDSWPMGPLGLSQGPLSGRDPGLMDHTSYISFHSALSHESTGTSGQHGAYGTATPRSMQLLSMGSGLSAAAAAALAAVGTHIPDYLPPGTSPQVSPGVDQPPQPAGSSPEDYVAAGGMGAGAPPRAGARHMMMQWLRRHGPGAGYQQLQAAQQPLAHHAYGSNGALYPPPVVQGKANGSHPPQARDWEWDEPSPGRSDQSESGYHHPAYTAPGARPVSYKPGMVPAQVAGAQRGAGLGEMGPQPPWVGVDPSLISMGASGVQGGQITGVVSQQAGQQAGGWVGHELSADPSAHGPGAHAHAHAQQHKNLVLAGRRMAGMLMGGRGKSTSRQQLLDWEDAGGGVTGDGEWGEELREDESLMLSQPGMEFSDGRHVSPGRADPRGGGYTAPHHVRAPSGGRGSLLGAQGVYSAPVPAASGDKSQSGLAGAGARHASRGHLRTASTGTDLNAAATLIAANRPLPEISKEVYVDSDDEEASMLASKGARRRASLLRKVVHKLCCMS